MTSEHRRQIKKEYGSFYDRVAEILFECDPIDINYGDNSDEYHPEGDTILPRLRSASDSNDVVNILHEEFIKWFDKETAGAKDIYTEAASKIWSEWKDLSSKT